MNKEVCRLWRNGRTGNHHKTSSLPGKLEEDGTGYFYICSGFWSLLYEMLLINTLQNDEHIKLTFADSDSLMN